MTHGKWFCTECGSSEVFADAWVSLNDSDDVRKFDKTYCMDCQQYRTVMRRIKQYDNAINNKFRIEMLDIGGWRPTNDPLFDSHDEAMNEIDAQVRAGHVSKPRRVYATGTNQEGDK